MAIYTIPLVSRQLVEQSSPLFLTGDDLVSRDLTILKADLGGRISVKSYSLVPRDLLLANVLHTGRSSKQTFKHASRALILERSTLKGIQTGSALYPEIVPAQIQFKPPKYMVTEHYAQSGEVELHLWSDSCAGATLQLDYRYVPNTTAEDVMSLWDAVYGTYKFITIPITVLAGVKQELAEYMLKGGDNAKWYFAEVPKWEGKLKGYGNLMVNLVSKINTL